VLNRFPSFTTAKAARFGQADLFGSMAHCRDFRAAAVARSANFEAIGIYAEPHEPLTSSLINAIAMPTEIHLLPSITKIGIASERLLYCTKEAVYKPWHPITKHYLDFTDVAINLNPNRTFTASGTNDSDAGLLARMSGRRAGIERDSSRERIRPSRRPSQAVNTTHRRAPHPLTY